MNVLLVGIGSIEHDIDKIGRLVAINTYMSYFKNIDLDVVKIDNITLHSKINKIEKFKGLVIAIDVCSGTKKPIEIVSEGIRPSSLLNNANGIIGDISLRIGLECILKDVCKPSKVLEYVLSTNEFPHLKYRIEKVVEEATNILVEYLNTLDKALEIKLD